jgi:hypothetical protein
LPLSASMPRRARRLAVTGIALAACLAACKGDDGPADPDGGGDECPKIDPELSETILGYDVMPSIELVFAPGSLASLEADPRTYVRAELKHDGTSYGDVGVRLKGQNSFLPVSQKASFRIKTDEYEPCKHLFGLTDLTLNNMSTDTSMMHDRLAYLVARLAGVPASRANHLLLTVDGELYGLYSNVETVKKKMIKRWFDDNDGPLFEATDVDFQASYIAGYELETGPDDRTLLTGLANALTMAPDAAIAAAAGFADLDAFRRFWAMASVTGHLDGFPYSNPGDDYFVYADPTSGKLAFIPWGMDEAFTAADFPVTQVVSVLAQKCKDSPACYQAYVDQTYEVLELTETMDLAAERARVAGVIAPYVAMDSRKPYDTAAVEEGQRQQGFFITGRRAWLDHYLKGGPRPF